MEKPGEKTADRGPAPVQAAGDGGASGSREKILTTALTLFSDRGFFGTPTSLISREAKVATGTLFFYFPTKEELIDTLYRRVKAEAAEAMCRGVHEEKTVKGKLRRLGFNAVDWGMKNPAKLKFMEQFAHSPFVSTTAQQEGMSHFLFLEDLVREGIQEGAIRDIDPALLFCMMASALSGLIDRASAVMDTAERDRLTGDGLEFIFRGMMP